MSKLKSTTQSEAKLALETYLDALLNDMPVVDDDPAMIESPAPAPAKVVKPERSLSPVAQPAEPSLEVQQGMGGGAEPPPANVRPQWGQGRFECLMFNVAGLKLAVPLVSLGGVLTLSEKGLTPLFGQAPWFMGLLPGHSGRMIKVVDTALWVMPEKYQEDYRRGMRYVILIEGCDWGLACHEVAEAVTLEPDQIRWRTERGKRPWLAGTVIDHMCAVMDISMLGQLLNADDKNFPKQAGQVAGNSNNKSR